MTAIGNNENKQNGYSSKDQQQERISLPSIASITGGLDLNQRPINGNGNSTNNNISLPPLASFGHSFQDIRRPVSAQPQPQSQSSSTGSWSLPPIQLAGTSRGLSQGGLPSLSSLPFTHGDGQHHQQQQTQSQQHFQNNFTQPPHPPVFSFQNQLSSSVGTSNQLSGLSPMGYQNQHQFSRPSSLPSHNSLTSPLTTPQQMSSHVQLPSLKDIGVNRPLQQQQPQQQHSNQGSGQLPSVSRSASGSVHGESRSSSVNNPNNVGATVFSPRPLQSLNLSTTSSYKNHPNTSQNEMYASPSASVVSVASESFSETSRPLLKENSGNGNGQNSSRKSSHKLRINQKKQQRSTSESASSTPSRSTLQLHSQAQPSSVKMSASSSTGSLAVSTSGSPTNPLSSTAAPASIINQRKAAVLAGPPRTSRFFRFFSSEAPRQTGVPMSSDKPNSDHYPASFKTSNLTHHYNPYIYPQNKNKVNPQPDFINMKQMTTNGLSATSSPTSAPPIPVLRPSPDEFKDPISYLESSEIKSLGEKYGAVKIIPPATFNQVHKFSANLESLWFKTRRQLWNSYENELNARLEFHQKLKQVLSESVVTLNKLPCIDKRSIDLYRLQKSVLLRGGYERCCAEKMWAQVGRELGFYGKITSSLSSSIKSAYQRYILPLDVKESNIKGTGFKCPDLVGSDKRQKTDENGSYLPRIIGSSISFKQDAYHSE
ncbi:unnamed protein product [Ambrosiozyma monospora]|uniref:Unnamed protein product n=1 Tax=Ambrosiozyma monospora TaxID=43982 RepID=A0A9W6Z117_AMBMO|nr:unnamed protein product [Ambrosiozyma monospora]